MVRRTHITRLFTVALMALAVGTAAAASFDAAGGDFNRDGRRDVAVLRAGAVRGASTEYRLEVFSAGDLRPVVLDRFQEAWHSHIVTRDVDGDLDPDIILFTANGQPSRVWINDGSGGWHSQSACADIRPEPRQSIVPGAADAPAAACAPAPAPSLLPRPGPAGRASRHGDSAAPSPLARPALSCCFFSPLFKRPPPAV